MDAPAAAATAATRQDATPQRAEARVRRTVVAVLLLANAALAGVVAVNLRRGHALRQEQAALTTQSLARLLERSFEAVFEKADLALLAVVDEHARQAAAGRPDGAALERVLALQKARAEDLLSLRIVDASGRVVRGAPASAEQPTVTDRDYFVAHRDAPGVGLFISRPAMGRIIKLPLVFLSRRLSRADGAFDGVAFATISLEHFAEILAEVEVGPRGATLLRYQDFSAVVRRSSGTVEPFLEPSAPSRPLPAQVKAGLTSGGYVAVAPKDGIERTYGWRRIGGRPFYVQVGLAQSDLYAGWWREVAQAVALLVLLAAVTGLGAWSALRALRRQRAADAALRESEARLHQAQRLESVGRLAGGVAHDFNNMLAVILGEASLLAADLPAGHPAQAGIREITLAGERSRDLTRQLLAFSRRQATSPRAVSLNALVEATRPALRRLLGEDVSVDFEPDGGLRPVRLDPHQFDQVLINLVVNASDAMPCGGRISVRTRRATLGPARPPGLEALPQGDYAVLEVRDEGHGMDAQTMARAFEPFFTTKAEGKGTGLGLATTYGIVQQAGGAVLVESAPGRGTTFAIYLPVTSEAATPAEGPAAAPARGRGAILLTEDEAPVRRTTRRLLESLGYQVSEAGSGQEAIEAAGRQAFDLLITDVMLPGMKGPEIAQRLRGLRPGLPTLFISGYAPGAKVEPGAHFLHKPFSVEDLSREVEKALRAGPARPGQ